MTLRHRLKLISDGMLSMHSALFGARPIARQFSANKRDQTLHENIFKSGTTGWAKQIVVAQEKDSLLRFLVEYEKLSTETGR